MVSGSPKSKPGEFVGYLEEVPVPLVPTLLRKSAAFNAGAKAIAQCPCAGEN